MSDNSVASRYFSGQGVVLLGGRDNNGKPTRLIPVGNVSDLKISVATTVVEHKESQTGQRGIDLRLQTETNATLSMTMESFNPANLAQALRGGYTSIPGGTVAAEPHPFFIGAVVGLRYVNVSAVTVNGAAELTPYTDDLTPWDYKLNAAAGSIAFNDGSILPFDAFGAAITAITVGATTVITVASTAGATIGNSVALSGLTGADAAFLNGNTYLITNLSSTTITFNAVTTGKTITATGTPKAVWDGLGGTVDYTYGTQFLIDALTVGLTDIYMRFEGLNTAEDNNPVVVEVFRFSTDPLKELDLISDTVQQFDLEGSVLLDAKQSVGSQYFNVKMIPAPN